MAQPKAQTLQQRFGFLDNDLKTANHDEIMIWLDEHAEKIAKEIINWSEDWGILCEEYGRISKSKVDDAIASFQRAIDFPHLINLKESDFLYCEDEQEIRDRKVMFAKKKIESLERWEIGGFPKRKFDIRKQWEHPVLSNKFTVGFVDMLVECWSNTLDFTGDVSHEYFTGGQLPIIREKFVGLKVCFEVKTKIPSLGELIRQINMYRAYVPSTMFFVVSQDDRFLEQLNSQGIGFVKYPSGGVFIHRAAQQPHAVDLASAPLRPNH